MPGGSMLAGMNGSTASVVPGNPQINSVDTIAALEALTPHGSVTVDVNGFFSASDGGGQRVRWVPASLATPLDGSVYIPAGQALGTAGRWLRVFDGSPVLAQSFGAIADYGTGNTNNSVPLQAALTVLGALGIPLIIRGSYLTSTTLFINASGTKWNGEQNAAIYNATGNTIVIDSTLIGGTAFPTSCKISGFDVYCLAAGMTGWRVRLSYSVLEQIYIAGRANSVTCWNVTGGGGNNTTANAGGIGTGSYYNDFIDCGYSCDYTVYSSQLGILYSVPDVRTTSVGANVLPVPPATATLNVTDSSQFDPAGGTAWIGPRTVTSGANTLLKNSGAFVLTVASTTNFAAAGTVFVDGHAVTYGGLGGGGTTFTGCAYAGNTDYAPAAGTVVQATPDSFTYAGTGAGTLTGCLASNPAGGAYAAGMTVYFALSSGPNGNRWQGGRCSSAQRGIKIDCCTKAIFDSLNLEAHQTQVLEVGHPCLVGGVNGFEFRSPRVEGSSGCAVFKIKANALDYLQFGELVTSVGTSPSIWDDQGSLTNRISSNYINQGVFTGSPGEVGTQFAARGFYIKQAGSYAKIVGPIPGWELRCSTVANTSVYITNARASTNGAALRMLEVSDGSTTFYLRCGATIGEVCAQQWRIGGPSGPSTYEGDAAPGGAQSGYVGDLYQRRQGAAGTTLYVKETELQSAAVNGVQALPVANLLVNSTAGYAAAGTILVGTNVITYTSVDATHFQNCSGGTGNATNGQACRQATTTGWNGVQTTGTLSGLVREIRYVLGTASASSVAALLATDYVISAILKITTPYTAGATISIGQAGSATAFQLTTDNNPQAAAGTFFEVEQDTIAPGAGAILATVAGAPAAGAAVVIIRYVTPDV